MYKKFNIENINIVANASYVQKYKKLFEKQQSQIREHLDNYVLQDGIIDGKKIQSEWFPNDIDVQIFISHSHKDKELAVNLACWIYEHFGIVSFIDSCVWGYSNELLHKLDAKYCKRKDDLYDYDKRNYSTSHVHMMLVTALNKMIDRAECLFFLNTQNSVHFKGIEERTLSPWIYAELEMTRTIQLNIPKRHKLNYCFFSKREQVKKINESSDLKISYPVNTGQLTTIDNKTLRQWREDHLKKTNENALDILYSITQKGEIIYGNR